MPAWEKPPTYVDPDAPIEHRGAPFLAGVGPGLVSGLVMLVVLCILALAREQPLLEPMYKFAAVFMGRDALGGGVWPAIVGLVVHFVVSGALGGLFMVLVGRTTRRRQLGLGMGYGVLLWLLAQLAFLPLAAPELAVNFGTLWPFFLGHLSYGLMLGASVPTTKGIDAPRRAYVNPLRQEVRP